MVADISARLGAFLTSYGNEMALYKALAYGSESMRNQGVSSGTNINFALYTIRWFVETYEYFSHINQSLVSSSNTRCP